MKWCGTTDNSYVEVPPAGSMPIRAGSAASGFRRRYLVQQSISRIRRAAAELKKAIRANPRFTTRAATAQAYCDTGVKCDKARGSRGPIHPLVRVHPVTGRRALYLGRRRDWPSNYIIGLPNDESEALPHSSGLTRLRPSTPGHINGESAISCSGTTAVACTIAPKSTSLTAGSCIARRSKAILSFLRNRSGSKKPEVSRAADLARSSH